MHRISLLMREEFEDKSLFSTRRRINIRREEENEDRKRNKSVSFLKNTKIRGEISHSPLNKINYFFFGYTKILSHQWQMHFSVSLSKMWILDASIAT